MNAPQDKNLKGKFLVINFWKSDCDVCDIGMKNVERLQEQFKEVKNLYFINLTHEDSAKVVKTFKAKNLTTSLITVSDKRKVTKLRTDGLKHIIYPKAIMVDPEGVIRYITFPQSIEKEHIQKLIDGKWEPFDAFYQQH